MSSSVLLFDGLCGFCDGFVQFILKRDRVGNMRFATLQGGYAREILARHPDLHGVDSLVLVANPGSAKEEVQVRSEAAFGVAEYIGGLWAVTATALRIVPRFLRDFGYDAFASVRYTVFGRYNSCPLPTAAQRARFID